MKKLTLILLVLITVFAFASCSDTENTQKEPKKVALENVYLAKRISIPEDIEVYNMYLSGDSVFFKGTEEEIIQSDDKPEEYKYYDVLYRSDKSFKNFDKIFSFESEYFWDEVTMENRSKYFENAIPDGKGGIWVVLSEYSSKPVDESMEEWINENNATLSHYDADGVLTSTIDCKELFSSIPDIDKTELDSLYISSLAQTKNDTVYIMTNSRITAISPDGTLIQTKLLDENQNLYSMTALDNGNLRTLSYDWTAEEATMKVYDYSIDTNEFKPVCSLSVNENIFMDSNGDIYSDDYYTVKRINVKNGEGTPVLDWINSDINCDRISQIVVDNGEFYTFEWDSNYEERSLLHLTPAGEGDVVEKYIMTLAANTISQDLKNMIIDYNRSSTDYRIQVKAYGWEDDASDKFDLDLLSGNVPDLICLDQLNAEKYATKGMFADLGEMLDNDKDISRDDFLPNILKAAEIKGKLYRLPTSFSARSLIGKTSIVGDKNSWTWDEFIKVMKKYPDAEMLSEFTRSSLMEGFLPLIIGDFIDYNTGKSNFTDGNFAKFLEYAKTLPEEIDWDKYYEEIDWEEYDNRYKNNQAILSVSYISSLDGDYYTEENFGEPITYIGYPTSSNNGNVIEFSSQFAIGANSAYKQQAWDFLKMVFEEEYQTEYIWDLPVIKSVFDKKKQNAIDYINETDFGMYYPEYDDDMIVDPGFGVTEDVEIAKEIYVDSVKPMPEEPVYTVDGNMNIEEMKAALLTSVDEFSRITTTATRLIRNKDPMIEVITSEVAPYFDGKKSIEETCKIIESRVNLYLAENM